MFQERRWSRCTGTSARRSIAAARRQRISLIFGAISDPTRLGLDEQRCRRVELDSAAPSVRPLEVVKVLLLVRFPGHGRLLGFISMQRAADAVERAKAHLTSPPWRGERPAQAIGLSPASASWKQRWLPLSSSVRRVAST